MDREVDAPSVNTSPGPSSEAVNPEEVEGGPSVFTQILVRAGNLKTYTQQVAALRNMCKDWLEEGQLPLLRDFAVRLEEAVRRLLSNKKSKQLLDRLRIIMKQYNQNS